MMPAGDGLEHREMGSARLVESGEERIDGSYAALRCDDEICPAPAGTDGSVRRRNRFDCADDGRADGDDPSAARPRAIHRGRCRRGHLVALRVGRLARLETGHAGVEQNRRDGDARGRYMRLTRSAVNGRPADGISALPGSVREHRLVGRKRPSLANVAVSDRRSRIDLRTP